MSLDKQSPNNFLSGTLKTEDALTVYGNAQDFSQLVPSDLGDLSEKLEDKENQYERANDTDVQAYSGARAKLEALIARLEAQGINIEGARAVLAEAPDGMSNQQLADLSSRADGFYREAAGKELQLSVSAALEAVGSGAKLELAWAESSVAILTQLAKPDNALSTKEAIAANAKSGYSITK